MKNRLFRQNTTNNMKRFLLPILITITILGLSSCSKSPEEKANALIENEIKASLYFPESYQNVATRLDSAFSPYLAPENFEVLKNIKELKEKIDKCNRNIDFEKFEISSAKSTMSIYSDGYSEYSRYEYKENKEKADEHEKKLQKLNEKKEKLLAQRKELLKTYVEKMAESPKFIGYLAIHRYRANNNAGQTIIDDTVFLLNEDLTQVLAVFKSDEFESYFKILEEFGEEYKDEFDEDEYFLGDEEEIFEDEEMIVPEIEEKIIGKI